ncbi:MAG: undecaprenyl-diphosphate phosphatase [Bacteroidales bacterium]|jgi:undecaprenyl-diphosphatase
MNWIEALILGIIQGLTEFLPVSSSGHLEISKVLLGVELEDNLTFSVVVHAATVCSTIIVFRKDIRKLLSGVFEIKWNNETRYIAKILLSAVPVVLVGLFLESQIESLFSGRLIFVAFMLLITALLLSFTYYARPKKESISFLHAFIIGLAQAFAVLPGVSRSGATIATALILKNSREDAARFSFLMVLLPILGKAGMDLFSGRVISGSIAVLPLIIGFTSSFLVGLIACKLMIRIVKNSKLIYFAIYCALVAGFLFLISI